MPKLRDIEWSKESASGETLEFTSTVTVDSEGMFFMSVPEYLVPIMKSLQEKKNDGGFIRYNEEVIRHTHGKFRVRGYSHKDCIDLITEGLEEFLACEVTRTPVIAYTFISSCHYGKDSEGSFYPNGYDDEHCVMDDFQWAKEHGKEGRFSGGKTPYTLGFRAQVVTKVLAERKVRSKITYENVDKETLGEWGEKLNRFNHTKLDFENALELPYTEDTARFFFESMINLCKLADRLASVLATPEKILEHSSTPALTAGDQENN